MADRALEERRRALEQAFFRKEDERLRAQRRAQREREQARAELARESGIHDEALLDRLIELGIDVETAEALVLVPLVEVAWADGKLDRREREAVLESARAGGLPPGSAGYELLEGWLADRPSPELMESWRAYIAALARELSADQRWALEERILGRARAVAEAAGGLLGLARVSKQEEAVLAELERAFGGTR